MAVSTESILDTASRVLAASPRASLADVAAAAGISRTTLFSRYATRDALLEGLAIDALERIDDVCSEAGVDDETRDPLLALAELTRLLIPIGSRLCFLLRERSLDENTTINARWEALGVRLEGMIRRGQERGTIRADLSTRWIDAAWWNLMVAAWEMIEAGRLAPADADRLVLSTLVGGVAPSR